jgi:hypothetical protein
MLTIHKKYFSFPPNVKVAHTVTVILYSPNQDGIFFLPKINSNNESFPFFVATEEKKDQNHRETGDGSEIVLSTSQ